MKLTDPTCTFNDLTSFEYEAHSLTGNGSYLNMLEFARKNLWNHSKWTYFLADFNRLEPPWVGTQTWKISTQVRTWNNCLTVSAPLIRRCVSLAFGVRTLFSRSHADAVLASSSSSNLNIFFFWIQTEIYPNKSVLLSSVKIWCFNNSDLFIYLWLIVISREKYVKWDIE